MGPEAYFILYWMLVETGNPSHNHSIPQELRCFTEDDCKSLLKGLQGLKVPGTNLEFSVFGQKVTEKREDLSNAK
jgi:hypothetical protein